jgi:type III secretion protein HrpB1
MDIQTVLNEPTNELIDQFSLAVLKGNFYVAGQLLDELAQCEPETAALPVCSTMLALAQGRAQEALQNLTCSGSAPNELRAICLQAIGDPTWEGLARSLVETSDSPFVRNAMRALLGQEAEAAA